MNVKESFVILRVYETRFLVQREFCKWRLNKNVLNSRQKGNHDECQCECKELDELNSCEKVTHKILVHVIVSVRNPLKLANTCFFILFLFSTSETL